eukprot:765385-Hanusia_phi.AAC.1
MSRDHKQFILNHSEEKLNEINYFIDGAMMHQTDFDTALVVAAYYNLDIIDYKALPHPDLSFKNTVIRYCDKTWYYFIQDKHRWLSEDEPAILKVNISEKIVNLFNVRKEFYNKKMKKCDEEFLKEKYLKMLKGADIIIKSLKDSGKKQNIVCELKYLFSGSISDPKIIELFDTVKHTIGFNNGVYDFQMKCLRDGKPDDYISKSVGYDYIEYDADDSMQKVLDDYLNQMYTNPNIKQYVLSVLGVAICCGRIEQFNIFWGDSGANGKSTLVQLLQKTFGDYHRTIPVALFTQKRAASNSASCEVERLKGARLATSSEPDKDDVFNLGIMKELSGHDRLLARKLFNNPIEFELYAQFILCCNEFPKIPLAAANDGGAWRRLKVIEHSSYFYEGDQPPSHIRGKTFFKKDPNIDSKLSKFPKYLMSKIIHNINGYYPKLKIEIPKEVEYATDTYQRESDLYREFFSEYLVIHNAKTSNKVNITELYGHCLRWCKNNSALKVTTTKPELTKKIEQYGLSVSKDKKYVLNVSFKIEIDSDEEDSDNEATVSEEVSTNDSDVIFSFKHWLKHTFMKNIEVTNSNDADSRIPTEYVYNEFIKNYNKPLSVIDKNMIQDIMSDYMLTEHNIDKKQARNKINTKGMCFIGIKLIQTPSGPEL